MTTANTLYAAVRDAWASIAPPAAEQLRYVASGWSKAAASVFVGVAPVDVDIRSNGFPAHWAK